MTRILVPFRLLSHSPCHHPATSANPASPETGRRCHASPQCDIVVSSGREAAAESNPRFTRLNVQRLLSFSSHSSPPHHTTASSPASLFPVTASPGLDAAHRLISRSGRDCGDKDPWSVTYLGFLEETLSVFEALGGPMQALRAARIVASPDFTSSQRYDRTAPMPELRTSKSKTSPPRRTVPASSPATRLRRSG